MNENNEEQNGTETEELSEDEIPTSDRFRKDQIHGFAFYLPEQKLTSDKYNRYDSKNLDHSKSEIDHYFVGLTERKTRKYQGETDEGYPEKYDHIENLISSKLTECIECDIEHEKNPERVKAVEINGVRYFIAHSVIKYLWRRSNATIVFMVVFLHSRIRYWQSWRKHFC